MDQRPPVSIIMVVYNENRHISAALDTLLRNNFRDFEVIVVLDGCTDRTPQIVRRYRSKDPRIRAYQLPRRYGQAIAKLVALSHARGSVYLICDGDDVYPPNYVEALAAPILRGAAVKTMPGKIVALNKGYWGKSQTEPNTEFDMAKALRTLFKGVSADYFRAYVDTDLSLGFFDWVGEADESLLVDTVLYIHTPSTITEVFNRERWVGEQRLRVLIFHRAAKEGNPVQTYFKECIMALLTWMPLLGLGINFYKSRRLRMPIAVVAARYLGFLVGIIFRRK